MPSHFFRVAVIRGTVISQRISEVNQQTKFTETITQDFWKGRFAAVTFPFWSPWHR